MPTVIGVTPNGTKLAIITAKGPASATTVGTGAAATLTLSYQSSEIDEILAAIAVVKISGLPDGVVLEGFNATKDGVTLKVFNPTGSDINVSANSVEADVLVEAL